MTSMAIYLCWIWKNVAGGILSNNKQRGPAAQFILDLWELVLQNDEE